MTYNGHNHGEAFTSEGGIYIRKKTHPHRREEASTSVEDIHIRGRLPHPREASTSVGGMHIGRMRHPQWREEASTSEGSIHIRRRHQYQREAPTSKGCIHIVGRHPHQKGRHPHQREASISEGGDIHIRGRHPHQREAFTLEGVGYTHQREASTSKEVIQKILAFKGSHGEHPNLGNDPGHHNTSARH